MIYLQLVHSGFVEQFTSNTVSIYALDKKVVTADITDKCYGTQMKPVDTYDDFRTTECLFYCAFIYC